MKKVLIVMMAMFATSVFASDNWQNSSGLNWKNGDGTLCWRDSSWTPATASPGCDGAFIATKPAKPAAPVVTTTKVTLQAETLFDFDKSVLKPEGIVVLNNLVTQLAKLKTEVIVAVGNTDNIGTDAYNMDLGARRAQAVKAYLASKGFSNVYTESKGKSNPVASNATADGRAKNRRVDIEVTATK